jgi:hypothetical protein
MTADLDQSGSRAEPPISDNAARQIASAFQVRVADVVMDALQAAAWNGPADDLPVWLEHRHRWDARGALGYLLSLRNALYHARRPQNSPND